MKLGWMAAVLAMVSQVAAAQTRPDQQAFFGL